MKNLYHKIKFSKLTLEHTIFFLIAISSICMSVIGALTNIPLGLSVITVVSLTINIVLNISCIIYSAKSKKWFVPSLLVVIYAAFVTFPLLWFSTGGATGSTTPYLIMSGFIAVIMFRGKLRTFFLVAIPLIFSIFIFLEMLYPDISAPYSSRTTHYVDLIIGLIVSFTVTAILAVIVLSRYHKAKLESEALVKQLGEISIRDPLTGIYNRRMLTSCLDEEMRKCYETNLPLSLCIVDIDHFKRVNDIYGHLCGDKILVELARVLSEFMSDNDILGRYGGEEFLIIFKNQTLHEALKTVEKFHKAIQEHDWENVRQITISCGVSEYVKGISYSDFVGGSDRCLYTAKETGRNKIAYEQTVKHSY